MIQCPICRALLNGAETCRRCRAELKQVQDVERQGRELVSTTTVSDGKIRECSCFLCQEN